LVEYQVLNMDLRKSVRTSIVSDSLTAKNRSNCNPQMLSHYFQKPGKSTESRERLCQKVMTVRKAITQRASFCQNLVHNVGEINHTEHAWVRRILFLLEGCEKYIFIKNTK